MRPEQIRLTDPASAEGVAVDVEDLSYCGHDASVRLRVTPDGPRITARVAREALPKPGARMKAVVSGTCLTFPAGD